MVTESPAKRQPNDRARPGSLVLILAHVLPTDLERVYKTSAKGFPESHTRALRGTVHRWRRVLPVLIAAKRRRDNCRRRVPRAKGIGSATSASGRLTRASPRRVPRNRPTPAEQLRWRTSSSVLPITGRRPRAASRGRRVARMCTRATRCSGRRSQAAAYIYFFLPPMPDADQPIKMKSREPTRFCSTAHLTWCQLSDILKQAMQVRYNPTLH